MNNNRELEIQQQLASEMAAEVDQEILNDLIDLSNRRQKFNMENYLYKNEES